VLLAGSRSLQDWGAAPVGQHTTDEFLRSRFVEGNPLDRNVITALLFFGMVVLFRRREEAIRLVRDNWPIALFLGYCGLSAIWSDYPGISFKRWTKALGDFVMIAIVLTDPRPAEALKRFLARPAFVLIPLSVLLIKFYPYLGKKYNPWDGTQSFIGASPDKNMLGMACLILGVAAVWRLLHALPVRNYRSILAFSVVLAMTLWLFWKANSMTSLSCFMMASALMVFTTVPAIGRNRLIIPLVGLSLLSVAFSALFLHVGTGMVETMGRDPTITGRTELWDELRQMDPNVLLGAGFETFWMGDRLEHLWNIFAWKPNEAHNGYFEVYLNLGAVGIGLLALVVVTGYRNAIRTFAVDPEGGRLRLAYILIGLGYSFTEAGFRTMNVVWIAFMMAATAAPVQIAAGQIAAEPVGAARRRQDRINPAFWKRTRPAASLRAPNRRALTDARGSGTPSAAPPVRTFRH